jgi:hypothetical protein
VRNIREIFEFVDDIKEIPNNINPFISIYPDVGTGTENIEFFEKYKISAEYADRKIITDIKNSARSQSFNKRRKLTRL